jgi:diguanylate cyclase (GGDEF)-like protein
MILLPKSAPEGARTVAERIRQAVEATPIPIPDGGAFHITVSGGVVIHENPKETLDAALLSVDTALYTAKNIRRNRIIMRG